MIIPGFPVMMQAPLAAPPGGDGQTAIIQAAMTDYGLIGYLSDVYEDNPSGVLLQDFEGGEPLFYILDIAPEGHAQIFWESRAPPWLDDDWSAVAVNGAPHPISFIDKVFGPVHFSYVGSSLFAIDQTYTLRFLK